MAPEDILVFGRSLGTGSAVELASNQKECGALFLMSPYTSIRNVAAGLPVIGSLNRITPDFNFLDMFNNIQKIPQVQCPIMIIHGEQDEVIPVAHGWELYQAAVSAKKLITPKYMTHNNFDLSNDILKPLNTFLQE